MDVLLHPDQLIRVSLPCYQVKVLRVDRHRHLRAKRVVCAVMTAPRTRRQLEKRVQRIDPVEPRAKDHFGLINAGLVAFLLTVLIDRHLVG